MKLKINLLMAQFLLLNFIFWGIAHSTNLDKTSGKTSLILTLYKNGALFDHKGHFDLKRGENQIALTSICPGLISESIYIFSEGVTIRDYSYFYRPITISNLLKSFVDKEVYLMQGKGKDCCVRKGKRKAKLVSFRANNAFVLTDDGLFEIESSKIIFPSLPEGLSDEPALKISLLADREGQFPFELMYLTKNLSWKACYTGLLSDSEKKIKVFSKAYIKNGSKLNIEAASLRLVAGDINFNKGPVFRDYAPRKMVMEKAMVAAPAPASPIPRREDVFEYHIYRFSEKLNLGPHEGKYLSLLKAVELSAKKFFILQTKGSYYYAERSNDEPKRLHPLIVLEVDTKEKGLNEPFPKGVFRVYKRDSTGVPVFVGEDRIPRVPPGEKFDLRLGKAFDITAVRKQTEFKRIKSKISSKDYYNKYISSYEIKVHNAKKKEVTVLVKENIPGDWTITKENIPHVKERAHLATWKVTVPAKGTKVLSYSVRIFD